MVFSGKSIRSVANKFLNKLIQLGDETAKADTWRSMYPFFCDQVLSTPVVAIESLKILDVLIDDGIVGDYKNLQKALLHKSDEVAHLTLDVLRKIKGLNIEARAEGVELFSADSSAGRMEKDIQNRVLSVLKKEDTVAEKTADMEKKVEELGHNIPEAPSDIVNETALAEKLVAEKTADMEKKVEELGHNIPETPSDIVNENALAEKLVAEKLMDMEKKVEELGHKIEAPSSTTQDYDTRFKALETGIEDVKKLVESNIVNENALAEKFVAEKTADIEKKVEELGHKIEAPSSTTQDYDTRFKALETGIEDVKKLVESNIVNENALAGKVTGQVLERIKSPEQISKFRVPPVPQFMQKTAEDSQYSKDQEVRVNSLDNTPETSIILLNWAKFLMEKVGRNRLADVLEYYVEIGWISEEVRSVIAEYANGIDYYVEAPAGDLLPEVHTKSFLFIEQLRCRKMDQKLASVPACR